MRRENNNKILALLMSVLFTGALACYSYFAIHELMEFAADGPFYTFCVLGWVSIAWSIGSWWLVRREILCPYLIFLLFFYLFTYGQCFIWTFGISTGVYGYPKEAAAQSAVREVKEFLTQRCREAEVAEGRARVLTRRRWR